MTKLRVLVVDDYPGVADVTCVLVGLIGHEACAASNGRDALEQVAAFQPHVVVLDLGLPDTSGYDVARSIRGSDIKQPFIAAMTGLSSSVDHVNALAAGIDMHVVKPATAENLGAIFAAALAKLDAR